MKLIVYGDSYVEGGGISWEYALEKKYISDYYDYKKINENNVLEVECNFFKTNNRWTTLLEKELNIEIENRGIPGAGWQYINYYFFKNELKEKNNKKENIYIFCCPRFFKRFMINNDYEDKDLYIAKHEDFNTIHTFESKKENSKNKIDFINNIFNKKVADQIYFQSVIGIINYLIINKKKFLFLPSWEKSLKESFVILSKDESKKKIIFFLNKKMKNDFHEIDDFYSFFILKNIKNINFNVFWKDENMYLPSQHPNIKAQEIIKNEYINYIQEII